MGSDLSIRRAREADVPRLCELMERAHRDAGAYFEDIDDDFDGLDGEYFPDGEFLVGEIENRVVASIAYREPGEVIRSFADVSAGTVQLKRFNVAPEYQRRGYGSRIYDELEARARNAGSEEVVLHTTGRQTAARRFYEKRGYDPVERTDIEAFSDPFELFVYQKRL